MESANSIWKNASPPMKVLYSIAFVGHALFGFNKKTLTWVFISTLGVVLMTAVPPMMAFDNCLGDELPSKAERVKKLENMTALEWEQVRCEAVVGCLESLGGMRGLLEDETDDCDYVERVGGNETKEA